jgi:hypothetical protein
MRTGVLIAALVAILAASIYFAHGLWTSVDFGAIPTSGYVAMALGIVFSLAIGIGLMALLFYSSRHGYDEAAHYRDPRDAP